MHQHVPWACLILTLASLRGSTFQPSQILGHWLNLPSCYCREEQLSSPLCGYSYTSCHIYLSVICGKPWGTLPQGWILEPSVYAATVFPPQVSACGFLTLHAPASSWSTELQVYRGTAFWWQTGCGRCFKGLRSKRSHCNRSKWSLLPRNLLFWRWQHKTLPLCRLCLFLGFLSVF